jgi:putative spermidine/putrescine transport system substrate-binding protein
MRNKREIKMTRVDGRGETPLPRRALLGAGLGGGLLVANLAGAAEASFSGVTLRVATWGGTWMQLLQQFVEPQIRARGATVEYVVGQPDDNLAKLIAARGQRPPIDLFEYSENDRTSVLGAGVLAPIDYVQLPNAQSIRPSGRLPSMVANSSTLDGIVYNRAKFQEAGLAPPRNYADLANPQLRDRLAFGDITTPQGVKGLIAIAYENGGNETNLLPGMQAIVRLAPRTFYKTWTQILSQFKDGDVWAAHWHAGWVVRGRQAGIPLDLALPPVAGQRGVLSHTWLSPVNGSPNGAAALAFINEYLALKPQIELGRRNGIRPITQRAADALAQEDPALAAVLPLSATALEQIFYPDVTKIDMDALIDEWNRTVLRG